jgi:hypothetical protein
MSSGEGVNAFKSGFPGGSGNFPDSQASLWGNSTMLKPYDIVILSCEGTQDETTKTQAHLDAMREYADIGGRVFASHWHNIWIGGGFQNGANNPTPAIASWRQVATWGSIGDPASTTNFIDENNNPKGTSFANWMAFVEPGSTRGQISLVDGTQKSTAASVDTTLAERWTFMNTNNMQRPQNFQFTTPQEVPLDQRCGKVVFSDMHVAGNPTQGNYPDNCGDANTPRAMTAQEKALAFMLFDLASCVGVIL